MVFDLFKTLNMKPFAKGLHLGVGPGSRHKTIIFIYLPLIFWVPFIVCSTSFRICFLFASV